MVINDGSCTREIKYSIDIAKTAFREISIFTRKLDLNLRKKVVECNIWSMALYGVGNWTLRRVDQKYLASFKLWCLKRMNITWTDGVNRSIKQS
jgi:hypothetical protein